MQCPEFSKTFLDDYKGCASDDECELVEIFSACSTRRDVIGLRKDAHEELQSCLPRPEELPECTTKPRPLRVEDGRIASDDLHDVRARCVLGECRARVEGRECGTGQTCTGIQLCISYQDTMGLTQFKCMDNLCGDRPLDCDCAESLCVVPGEAMRMCATEAVEMSDVHCKTVLR